MGLKAEIVGTDSNGNVESIHFGDAMKSANVIGVGLNRENRLGVSAVFLDADELGAPEICQTISSSGTLDRI